METAKLIWEEPARTAMQKVIAYIDAIEDALDEDVFDVSPEKRRHLAAQVTAGQGDVSYQDMLFLAMLADATAQYSGRGAVKAVDAPDTQTLDALRTWLRGQEDALFRRKRQGGQA